MSWNDYGMRNSFPIANNGIDYREMGYNPVTAYTAVQPIYVNGENINTGAYPVLNFQPEGTDYPYIYVPIADFSKVGARVNWNEKAQLLSVETDYFTNKSRIADYKAKLSFLERGQLPAGAEEGDSPKTQYFTYGGKMEGRETHQIDGVLWDKASYKQEISFTPGKAYKGLLDILYPLTSSYNDAVLILIDDNGQPVTFRTRRIFQET
ncbi:hypothetical protein [Bacillus carboniphilus]